MILLQMASYVNWLLFVPWPEEAWQNSFDFAGYEGEYSHHLCVLNSVIWIKYAMCQVCTLWSHKAYSQASIYGVYGRGKDYSIKWATWNHLAEASWTGGDYGLAAQVLKLSNAHACSEFWYWGLEASWEYSALRSCTRLFQTKLGWVNKSNCFEDPRRDLRVTSPIPRYSLVYVDELSQASSREGICLEAKEVASTPTAALPAAMNAFSLIRTYKGLADIYWPVLGKKYGQKSRIDVTPCRRSRSGNLTATCNVLSRHSPPYCSFTALPEYKMF